MSQAISNRVDKIRMIKSLKNKLSKNKTLSNENLLDPLLLQGLSGHSYRQMRVDYVQGRLKVKNIILDDFQGGKFFYLDRNRRNKSRKAVFYCRLRATFTWNSPKKPTYDVDSKFCNFFVKISLTSIMEFLKDKHVNLIKPDINYG